MPRRSAEASDSKKKSNGFHFVDVGCMSDNLLAELRDEPEMTKRRQRIMGLSKSSFTKEDILKPANIGSLEELTAMALFLFGVPGAAFVLPVILILVYFASGFKAFAVVFALLAVLAVSPVQFTEKNLASWPAVGMLRYFSFKAIFTTLLDKGKPYILVAPPHGVIDTK